MASKPRPQRSCVACRAKRDKRMLTRLVFARGKLRIDESGKMNGRGAYLCAMPIAGTRPLRGFYAEQSASS